MIQDPTGGLERNVLNNWAPPPPVLYNAPVQLFWFMSRCILSCTQNAMNMMKLLLILGMYMYL